MEELSVEWKVEDGSRRWFALGRVEQGWLGK